MFRKQEVICEFLCDLGMESNAENYVGRPKVT